MLPVSMLKLRLCDLWIQMLLIPLPVEFFDKKKIRGITPETVHLFAFKSEMLLS